MGGIRILGGGGFRVFFSSSSSSYFRAQNLLETS